MFEDASNNDINQASYKLAKIALRNTPSKNAKDFVTTAQREAKTNEGKVSSIINLVDEIDTTIYVINDKILNEELRGYNDGLEGGGKQKKEVSSIYKVPNKFLMKEVRDRGISKSRKKDDLVRDLDSVKDEVVSNFNESLKRKKMEDEEQQNDVVSVDGSVVSDSDDAPETSEAVQDANNTSNFIQGIIGNNGGDGGYDSSSDDDNGSVDSGYDRSNYDTYDSDDTGSSGISDETGSSGISDETGSSGSSSNNDKIIQINTNPDNGGDDYFTGATNDIGDLVKSNLNTNIMKLEEQTNRLSKLTKGLNKFINYSSSVETEKLKESNTTLNDSYMYLLENLNDDNNVDVNFDRKIVSILNKLDTQINLITSALNGYAGVFTGGSFGSDFLTGFKQGFDGTIDSAKKVAELGLMVAPFVGGNQESNLAYTHSSKKRFY